MSDLNVSWAFILVFIKTTHFSEAFKVMAFFIVALYPTNLIICYSLAYILVDNVALGLIKGELLGVTIARYQRRFFSGV